MLTVSAGQSLQVLAIARDANGEPVEMASGTWSTSSEAVVTVAEGAFPHATLEAVAPGSATVSVELVSLSSPDYKITGTAAVLVPDVSMIDFSEDPLLMDPGDSRTVTATPRDPAGVAHATLDLAGVVWTVEPAGLVTITPTDSLAPTVTALAPGVGVVTVRGTHPSGSSGARVEVVATLAVRVAGAVSVGIEPSS